MEKKLIPNSKPDPDRVAQITHVLHVGQLEKWFLTQGKPDETRVVQGGTMSAADLIAEVLKVFGQYLVQYGDGESGMTAAEIMRMIRARWWVKVSADQIGSCVSRLIKQGEIRKIGDGYALKALDKPSGTSS